MQGGVRGQVDGGGGAEGLKVSRLDPDSDGSVAFQEENLVTFRKSLRLRRQVE